MRHGIQQQTQMVAQLRTNPRLYQAMDLLTIPAAEMEQALDEEVVDNPFLEEAGPENDLEVPPAEGEPSDEGAPPASDPLDRWERLVAQDDDYVPGQIHEVREDDWGEVAERGESLQTYLTRQAELLSVSARTATLVGRLIDEIDGDGYLRTPLLDAVAGVVTPPATLSEASEALRLVQSLQPTGVGARDLSECLLLQLQEKGASGGLAARLLQECPADLALRRHEEMARRTKSTVHEVQAAMDELRRLTPYPGRAWGGAEPTSGTLPDFVVRRDGEQWQIELTDARGARLRLSEGYRDMLDRRSDLTEEQREYLTGRLQAATWILQAIEQRRQTMLKVMRAIVARQEEFLRRGLPALKPLTLREVAEDVGMHESTISRVVNGKSIQTPRGVLALRQFFSTGLTTDMGEAVSSRHVRHQIQQLIQQEPVGTPLTDQDIAVRLQEQGVHVARRTVAKYREQLGLPTAKLRRRVE